MDSADCDGLGHNQFCYCCRNERDEEESEEEEAGTDDDTET